MGSIEFQFEVSLKNESRRFQDLTFSFFQDFSGIKVKKIKNSHLSCRIKIVIHLTHSLLVTLLIISAGPRVWSGEFTLHFPTRSIPFFWLATFRLSLMEKTRWIAGGVSHEMVSWFFQTKNPLSYFLNFLHSLFFYFNSWVSVTACRLERKFILFSLHDLLLLNCSSSDFCCWGKI